MSTADPRQVDMFGNTPDFDGGTYEHELDFTRLDNLLGRVWRALQDGRWWTLRALVDKCGGSEAGISARLRDYRKEKFGAFYIQSQRVKNGNGLWEYRLNRGASNAT